MKEQRFRIMLQRTFWETALHSVRVWTEEGNNLGIQHSVVTGECILKKIEKGLKKPGDSAALLFTQRELFTIANAISDHARWHGGDKDALRPVYLALEGEIRRRFKQHVCNTEFTSPVHNW